MTIVPRRLPLIAAGTLALGLAIGAPAQVWSPPVTVAGSAFEMRSPAVAVNATGFTCATWIAGGRVQARLRSGTTWSAVASLSPPGFTATEPTTAVTSNGRAVVAWSEAGVSGQVMRAATYSGGRWGTPVTIAGPAARVSSPRVRVNGRNDAILTWSQGDAAGACSVMASASTPAGWSAPASISGTTGCWSWVRLAAAQTGEALAVFSNARPVRGGFDVWVSSRNGGTGAWSAPQLVGAATYRSGEPSVALAENGLAIVTWGDAYGTNWSRRAPDGTWTVPATIDDTSGTSYMGTTDVAMDAAGNAVVAMGAFDMTFTYQTVLACRLGAASNRWTPPVLVTFADATISSFQAAATPLGTFVIGWSDGEYDVVTGLARGAGESTLAPGSGWRRQLFGSGDDQVAVAAAPSNGVVLWNVATTRPYVIRASVARLR